MRVKNLPQWKAKIYYFTRIGSEPIFFPDMKSTNA